MDLLLRLVKVCGPCPLMTFSIHNAGRTRAGIAGFSVLAQHDGHHESGAPIPNENREAECSANLPEDRSPRGGFSCGLDSDPKNVPPPRRRSMARIRSLPACDFRTNP